MRIVVAPQSLKGSLTAAETGTAIAEGVHAVYPEAEIEIVPVADGGEGTVQALVDATGGKIVQRQVTGPLGEPVIAFFGLLGDDRTAAIEMAASSGLPLVPPDQRNPLDATTYGVGELFLAALEMDRTRVIVGIGGSATNDGGAGMAQALGASLFTSHGTMLARGGAALIDLEHISLEQFDPRLKGCTFEVACDVSNPLCGPTGASAIYGPQKGATPEMVTQLDTALDHYASVIEKDLGKSVRDIPGAGAAGGLGAGLIAFLDAKIRPGAELILEAVGLEEKLRGADLVITAEGQLDGQTLYGKSVGAVATVAKRHGVPVLALAGSLGADYASTYELGIDGIAVLPSGPMTLADSMSNAAELTRDATERALRIMKLGGQVAGK